MLLLSAGAAAADTGRAALWAEIRAGTAFAIMRHALAPGTGDPADFSVDDCTTQRNLSDEGRRQAEAIGQGGDLGILAGCRGEQQLVVVAAAEQRGAQLGPGRERRPGGGRQG